MTISNPVAGISFTDVATIASGTSIVAPTIVGGTITSATLVGCNYNGGTITSATTTGLTINRGIITSATIVSPAFAGTILSATLASPTVTNPTVTTGTFTSATITSPTITNPTQTGGTQVGGTITSASVVSPALSGTTTTIGPLLVVATAGSVGYGTGSGVAVTQASSKTTTVVTQGLCGQITTNNAQLLLGATVTFQMTNTSLAATDMLLLSLGNPGGLANVQNYNLWPAVGAGAAQISLKNISAGNLSEAVVINFTILKGVTS